MHPMLNIAIRAARTAGNIIARGFENQAELQIEAKVNTNNLHDILDSNIVVGTDKVETTLTYPTINMILLGAQFIFSLIVVFLFFQAYEFVDRFWIRVFTTLVLMGSSVATIIYVVYLNEEELE